MLTNILKSIFPDSCILCKQDLSGGEIGLCDTCLDALPNWPQSHDPEEFALQIFAGRSRINKLIVLSSFHPKTKLQMALHHIKYKNGIVLANRLGQSLGHRWRSVFPEDGLICPVPLHPQKQERRGYNQSEIISDGIQAIVGGKVLNLIRRDKATPTQTSLSREKRWKNVESAFSIPNAEPIQDKMILLVDDTLTTGATMEACARLLTKNGAREVWATAIGYAP